MITLDAVLTRLPVRWVGDQGWALCPCHQERTPSLSVRQDAQGLPILHCFGCGVSTLQVLQALGFELNGGTEVYVAPPADDAEAARREVIAEARLQPWNRGDMRLLYAGSDLHRALEERIGALHAAAAGLGAEDPASWDMLERANALEAERRLLERGLDGLA